MLNKIFLRFDKIFMLSLEIFSTYTKKNAQKTRQIVAVDKTKSAYVIYEWPPSILCNGPCKSA